MLFTLPILAHAQAPPTLEAADVIPQTADLPDRHERTTCAVPGSLSELRSSYFFAFLVSNLGAGTPRTHLGWSEVDGPIRVPSVELLVHEAMWGAVEHPRIESWSWEGTTGTKFTHTWDRAVVFGRLHLLATPIGATHASIPEPLLYASEAIYVPSSAAIIYVDADENLLDCRMQPVCTTVGDDEDFFVGCGSEPPATLASLREALQTVAHEEPTVVLPGREGP